MCKMLYTYSLLVLVLKAQDGDNFMEIYCYHSEIGIFKIYPHQGRYNLEISGTVYGSYRLASSAADDVYMHSTGCDQWDDLDGKVDSPMSLDDWEIISC